MLPAIRHVWSERSVPDAETARRMAVARASWLRERAAYAGPWVEIALRDGALLRNASSLGDAPVPFVRDMVVVAANGACPRDVVLLSNADVGFAEGAATRIAVACSIRGAAFCRRCDFDKPLAEPPPSRGSIAAKGRRHRGCDVVAFTAAWWQEHEAEVPDLLLGRDGWDRVFKEIIYRARGLELLFEVFHEEHESAWQTRPESPGNLWNNRLVAQFFKKGAS